MGRPDEITLHAQNRQLHSDVRLLLSDRLLVKAQAIPLGQSSGKVQNQVKPNRRLLGKIGFSKIKRQPA
jgi:hypothetical protein